jgi:gamma-glutamylcyclotransferase
MGVEQMSEMVFAFGSNMCSGRFRDYGVEPIGSGRAALLDGFRLVFNKLSKKDSSGKANLSPAAGHQVWGVLYEISSANLAVLDSSEGRGYRRLRLPARTIENGMVDAG